MAIMFDCKCGQSIQVDDEFARQEVECPYCQAVVTAPAGTRAKVVKTTESRTHATRDDEEAKPVRKKRRRPVLEEDDDDNDRRPKQSYFSGSVVGGALAMVVAVIWFVLGLFADRIFIYPPIMFILGLVAVIRGLMGHED